MVNKYPFFLLLDSAAIVHFDKTEVLTPDPRDQTCSDLFGNQNDNYFEYSSPAMGIIEVSQVGT